MLLERYVLPLEYLQKENNYRFSEREVLYRMLSCVVKFAGFINFVVIAASFRAGELLHWLDELF